MARKAKPGHNAAIIERIEMCGQCQMNVTETAILCAVDEGEITDGGLTAPYLKGKLEAELAVRRSMVQKAQDGDAAAQREFLKLASATRVSVE